MTEPDQAELPTLEAVSFLKRKLLQCLSVCYGEACAQHLSTDTTDSIDIGRVPHSRPGDLDDPFRVAKFGLELWRRWHGPDARLIGGAQDGV